MSAEEIDDIWGGFYRKPLQTRQDQINLSFPGLEPHVLPTAISDNMVENCIGNLGLPLALGLNFKINGKPLVIPMCTEEPSVVAAVSGAAKTISSNGGFTASYTGNIMVSQIQILDLEDVEAAIQKLRNQKAELIDYGNQFCPTMKRRGGGLLKIVFRSIPFDRKKYFTIHHVGEGDQPSESAPVKVFGNNETPSSMLVLHLHIDVCESMGANTVNTVAEGLGPRIVEIVGGRLGFRIVTNYSLERRATSKFMVRLSKLGYKKKTGEEIAKGILEGYTLACEDHFRAVTHNKGIMNGIDAAALATGQDFRAIEAGAHAWASRTGKYQPLTHYRIVDDGDELSLEGTIEIPLAVGIKGGAIQSHPTMQFTHGVMNSPDCQTLAEAIVSLGLAQNFAAMRAMASEGIQRGHMSLHARNIAIQAGVPTVIVPEVSAFMIKSGNISVAKAKEYLSKHSMGASRGSSDLFKKRVFPPSTLLVDLNVEGSNVSLHVVFESLGNDVVHLIIKNGKEPHPIQEMLFGPERDARWVAQIFNILTPIALANKSKKRSNIGTQHKVKLISILLNLLQFKLIEEEPQAAHQLVENILSVSPRPLDFLVSSIHRELFLVGAPLLIALWNVMKNEIDQIPVLSLASTFKEEQLRIITASTQMIGLRHKAIDLEQLMTIHSRRFPVTIFLLCELLTVDPYLITPQSLDFLLLLGNYLEWEGTLCHDLAYWEQAQHSIHTNNVYLWWLNQQNKLYLHSPETMEEFVSVTNRFLDTKKYKLLAMRDAAPFFDVSLFMQSSQNSVAHYFQVMEIIKKAKV